MFKENRLTYLAWARRVGGGIRKRVKKVKKNPPKPKPTPKPTPRPTPKPKPKPTGRVIMTPEQRREAGTALNTRGSDAYNAVLAKYRTGGSTAPKPTAPKPTAPSPIRRTGGTFEGWGSEEAYNRAIERGDPRATAGGVTYDTEEDVWRPRAAEKIKEDPMTTKDKFGKLKFNTGDPALDDFLNNIYTPLIEAELGGKDPNTIFDSEAFKKIKERVDSTWGPIFEKELKQAEDTYNLSKTGVEAGRTKTLEDIATERTRLGEDVETKKVRIARNYTQAQTESDQAMSARKLTFGGSRKKATDELGLDKQQELGDLATVQQRSLQDLASNEEYQTGTYGRQLTELEQGFDKTKSDLEGEKTLQYAAERERLRALGSSLIKNPEFY